GARNIERVADTFHYVVDGDLRRRGDAEDLRVLVKGANARECIEIIRQLLDERGDVFKNGRNEEIKYYEKSRKYQEIHRDDREDPRKTVMHKLFDAWLDGRSNDDSHQYIEDYP